MKKFTLIIFTAALTLFAASCEKTSEGVTEVINYFQVNGALSMYLGVGETFVDPGYVELRRQPGRRMALPGHHTVLPQGPRGQSSRR